MKDLGNYSCEGQMNIFDFLDNPKKPDPIEQTKEDYWKKPLMERVHPRVQELYKAMMNTPFSSSRTRIIQAYNENKGLNYVADVCKEEYGTGGFSTDYGFVDYDSKKWVYKYDEPWEGVYQDELTWREFARRICELIEARYFVPYEPVCTFSSHICNKQELWKVADSLDETMCPHVCCRSCNTKMCGARCNGSEEPKSLKVQEPCGRKCEVECWSRKCFEKRGQIWDYHKNQWMRNMKGEIIKQLHPECDWEPGAERQEPHHCEKCIFKIKEGCSRWELYSEVERCDINLKNDIWYKAPEKLPDNKDWEKALFVIHNKKTNEFHYNMPGEVKDKTFKRPANSPEGEVIAWRYTE